MKDILVFNNPNVLVADEMGKLEMLSKRRRGYALNGIRDLPMRKPGRGKRTGE